MAYANAEMQKKLIIITAIPGIMDEWAQESAFKPQKRKLGLIAKHANDIKDWMLKDLEPESIEMVKRRCVYQTLAIVNRAKPLHGYYIVSEDDMETLIQAGAETNCLGCDKRGKDMRRCKYYKTYLRCGIATDKMERTDGGCPFEW